MNSTLIFETIPTNEPEYLGLLENKMTLIENENENENHHLLSIQELVFLIDLSSSMTDTINHQETSKIENIKTMLINMITYLITHPIHTKVYISVFGFNDRFFPIVNHCRLSSTKAPAIIQKLQELSPFGLTNMELAMTELYNKLSHWTTRFPNRKFHALYMTDGQATRGLKTSTELEPLVLQHSNVKNIFLGFGVEHDFDCLHTLSTETQSEYYFIDKLEALGMIYGDIMHSIFFKTANNVRATLCQGQLFNYRTNEWCEQLSLHDLVSNTTKIYHVKSTLPEQCRITLEYDCLHTGEHKHLTILPTLNSVDESEEAKIKEKENQQKVQKSVYRLRTLQLLFGVYTTTTNTNALQAYLEELTEAIHINGWEQDALMKMLRDDVSIAIKTLHSSFGKMYACARQTSQGCQRGYTVTFIPEQNRKMPTRRIQRQITMTDDVLNNWIQMPQPTDNTLVPEFIMPPPTDGQTPYASNQCTQMMYEFSKS